MSKAGKKFLCVGIWVMFFIVCAIPAHTQASLEATITVKSQSIPVIDVSGRFAKTVSGKTLFFDRSSGGVVPNGNGVTDLKLFDTAGRPIAFHMVGPQKFEAGEPIAAWSYLLDLSAAGDLRSAAHLSWLADDRGVLMLRDIFPSMAETSLPITGTIHFELPTAWVAAGGGAANSIKVNDFQNAVVVIGKNVRTATVALKDVELILNVTGNRQFTDAEAAAMAEDIVDEYRKVFGSVPFRSAQISLVEHDRKASPGYWTAETRGMNVTIVSKDMAFKQQSLQRLHEQLRHEIFHLWMPNAVSFSGRYDWFYEGFALYESLKTGVRLNRITFDDMLDTLSRAYLIDRSQKRFVPMAEASADRFFGGETQVYARGMLLAFMTDVAMLDRSRGKRSAETLVRNVFETGRDPNKMTDGNLAVTTQMLKYPELSAIVNKYVKGSSPIELATEIEAAGLEFRAAENGGRFAIKANPNAGQKRLLDKLGYNNWRKLSRR